MQNKLFFNQSKTVPPETFQHLINSLIAKYHLYIMVYIYFCHWLNFYDQILNSFYISNNWGGGGGVGSG